MNPCRRFTSSLGLLDTCSLFPVIFSVTNIPLL